MAKSDATFDIILLFGPPLPNKYQYVPSSYLHENIEKICPEEIFAAHPDYGLRDLALMAVSALKQNKQVLFIDEIKHRSTRKSLVDTLKKKIPTCQVLLIEMIPKYGYNQIMWLQQFAMVNGELLSALKDEDHAKQWFDTSLQNVDYESGFVDRPIKEEGFCIDRLSLPLHVQTSFKFEFPGLLFQWEGVLNQREELEPHLEDLCSQWSADNPAGRIIFICDGKNLAKGILPSDRENSNIKRCLKELVVKIDHPVYALQLTTVINAGNFHTPPQPGILAFLQLRHLLDFQCKGTCYVFSTVDHMRMAEACGIRHLKISAALKSPDKVLKGHGITPSVPAMLRTMVVNMRPDSKQKELLTSHTLPLFDNRHEMKDGHLSHKFQHWLEEHIFVKDMQHFCQYQEMFVTCVTPVDQQGSTMLGRIPNKDLALVTSDKKMVNQELVSKEDDSKAKIPEWMKRKKLKRESTMESPTMPLEKRCTIDSNDDSSRSSKTVYVMSEREISDMARQILLEGLPNLKPEMQLSPLQAALLEKYAASVEQSTLKGLTATAIASSATCLNTVIKASNPMSVWYPP